MSTRMVVVRTKSDLTARPELALVSALATSTSLILDFLFSGALPAATQVRSDVKICVSY